MKRIRGIKASPGIAIGRAFVLDRSKLRVERKAITAKRVAKEVERFLDAVETSRKQIEEIRSGLTSGTVEDLSTILDTHIMLLEDKTLKHEVIKLIKTQRVKAEWAVSEVIGHFLSLLEKLGDEYLGSRAVDLNDIKRRILANLGGGDFCRLDEVWKGAIVVAHELTPSETAQMDTNRVVGFVTELGSRTSHAAIMARALEIPAVVGAVNVLKYANQGTKIIVDGLEGAVIISPTKKHLEEYERKREAYQYYINELLASCDLPAETRDGFRIAIEANIEAPQDVKTAFEHGAAGIGLYRTEYLFIHQNRIPTEEEHFITYKSIAEQVAARSATIRTVDIGGEKLVDAIKMPDQLNPALGLRAIRLCFARPAIFKQQIRGILRASAYGNLKIMFPMISGIEELKKGKAIVQECKKELAKARIPFNEQIEIGIMVEIPSAALTADILAKECDFFSIGTNDLIQYSLAIDRANEEVAYLYNPLHPAVLRTIKMVVDAAHRNKVRVGVCGEMAGEPLYALMLIGLGVDELSMNAIAIPAVKKIIRSSLLSEALQIASKALSFRTAEEVQEYIYRVMLKRYPQEIASLVF